MSKINISLSLDGTTPFKERGSGLSSGYYKQNEIFQKYKKIFTKDIMKMISSLPKKARDVFNDTMKPIVELAEGSVKIISLYCPEVYLHPRLQIAIVDFLINVYIQQTNAEVYIHTNSKIVLLRFGDYIIDECLKPEDIIILLKDSRGEWRDVSFNERGILSNWEYGFFYPYVDTKE